ncbi:Tkl protein kinase, partial [Globisporangium polare]
MPKSVFPALQFIFDLLQKQQKTASDIEAVQFCTALSRFQRHLRTAKSENSTRRYARSRKVAESNSVIYSELDRLLDMLGVSAEDPIRQWKHNFASSQQVEAEYDATADTSESSGGVVSVVYFDSPSTNHELWTQTGLKSSQATQPWTLPLKDVLFSDSDRIGKGAFGEVFKGSWLGTPAVVKFMGYEDDKDTIPTDLLLHEVRVWHRLNHPHVLRLYGASHQDKRYFVCEFASNGGLLDFLEKPGNEKLAWQKLYEIALGLQYLHGQNVAHNDLKCDNIMVGMDGNAKLIDFGLSCLLNEAEIRIEKKAIGAVNWRSPEYLAGGRPSFASDVYSFAMCIIEVVSGEIPWGRSMSAVGIRHQLKKGNKPNLPDSVNDKQRNLIKLMTKGEPSERVRMAFVVDKLSEIAREESFADASLQ